MFYHLVKLNFCSHPGIKWIKEIDKQFDEFMQEQLYMSSEA